MPDKEEEMPGELLKVFPANNLQMMFLSGAKGTQVTLFSLPLQWLLSLYLACFLQLLVVVLVPEQYPKKSFWGLLGLLFFSLWGDVAICAEASGIATLAGCFSVSQSTLGSILY